MAIFNPKDNKFYCECGCGEQIPFYNQFALGHNMRTPAGRKQAAEIVEKRVSTPESRKAQSDSLKRYWDSLTPTEYWERIGNSIHSEASRKAAAEVLRSFTSRGKRSRNMKAWWENLSPERKLEEIRRRVQSQVAIEASAETLRTPEARAKRSRIVKRFWARLSPEEFERALQNGICSEASRKARTESLRTPEARARLSRTAKLYWADYTPEEKAEKIRNNPFFQSQGSLPSPNKTEKMLQKFLEERFPGMFIPDWEERIDIGGRHPDFYTKNGYKLVIESNGSRFHMDWGEEEQITHYKKHGWTCIVVWANGEEDIIFEWPNIARQINTFLEDYSGKKEMSQVPRGVVI